MDTLRLKGLKFRGMHGVFEHEKQNGNNFEVDILIRTSLRTSAYSDNLSDTIDYAQLHDCAKEVMLGPSKNLIEHLAFQIGEKISVRFPSLNHFEVTVRKLNPPIEHTCEYSEVTLSWPGL
ncbi:MAG: dihydroneopterin aldolase [bacterium]|nr:dihydroneopterin aldolase [bacterium]